MQVQELFSQPYFCQQQSSGWFGCAEAVETSEVVAWASKLARELRVVLPTSFFEKKNHSYYNSVAMVDADGKWCIHPREQAPIGAPATHSPLCYLRAAQLKCSLQYCCNGVGMSHCHRRCAWHLPQEPYTRRPRLPRKVLFQPWR